MLKTRSDNRLCQRQLFPKVLIEKIKPGYFTEREAKGIAKRMFYDNHGFSRL